jgi:molecular chaperone DnaK
MSTIVGIDLGTTNSLVAVMAGGKPSILANRSGKRLTPSVVGLDSQGQVHVGESARNQLPLAPERTIAEVKRRMGSSEVVQLGDRGYKPQEISAFILKSLRDDAERHFGSTVTEAVVTVPAYFTDAQRQATRDAGELAGLTVERILNEPTAAALAYGIDRLEKEEFILVYDLGGGTFDVSVLEMFSGVLEVRASAGNSHLGGSDFDRAIVDFLVERTKVEHGLDLTNDAKARARIKAAAESAKIDLSTARAVPIVLPFVGMKNGQPVSVETELTRAKLESLIGDAVRSTLGPIKTALKDANLDRNQVSEVVLVGGSSRIPLVYEVLEEFFGKPPRGGINPDEAVALGAAVQAGLKSGAVSPATGIMITDVSAFTLGVEVMSRSAGGAEVGGLFSPIIPRNSTVPISRTEVYRTTADNQRVVNIRVYQGEDRLVKNNVFLDAYEVEGVPPASAGSQSLAVTFTYDLNGILNVKTKIVSTGKEATLVVDKSPHRLSPLERQESRARLEREWAKLGEHGEEMPPPGRGSGNAPPAGGPDLVAVAKAKLAMVDAEQRGELEGAIAALERARSANDATGAARADAALIELLFDLD